MTSYARAFKITVWIGIIVNAVLGVATLFAPDRLLTSLGFDVAYPNVWPRFAAWLLLLLSLFYIPGANDINRYRANAWLSVGARFSGVLFFAAVVLIGRLSSRYLLFGLIDLVFAVPTGALLVMAIRRQRLEQAGAAQHPRRQEVSHVMAAANTSSAR